MRWGDVVAELLVEKKQQSILVIEDDEDMNELICAILDTAGYNLISCLDGKEGISQALKHKPDLVLLDINLPELNGIEVCRNLGANDVTKNIPIIMLTIRRELSVKLSCYIAGAKRILITLS